MFPIIAILLIGVLVSVGCSLIGGLTEKTEGKTIALLFFGIISLLFAFIGGAITGTGDPMNVKMLSTNSIYTIQARFPYNDGIHSVVVLKRDAEDPNSGFLLVGCNSKELPDVNLVRVKDKKFIPFTLCPSTK
jgi:hypothetical protein